jgi:8-oxo-dGTP diphosphatase
MTESITPAIILTADVVLFARSGGSLHVLLIERGWPPFKGCWALPGGYVEPGERFLAAARRELTEETCLTAPVHLRQVGIYDAPERDPRGRVVTVAYTAVLPVMTAPTAGDDARAARWVPVRDLVFDGLAFDHGEIVSAALALVSPVASDGHGDHL